MASAPLVSVVIPTWNRAHTIGRALRAALDSTYAPLEVIVCDNASEDETMEVLADFADDSRLRVIRHEVNLGPVPNWESGLVAAQGQFTKILWSDDSMDRETITRLVAPMIRDPSVGFTVGPAVISSQDSQGETPQASGQHYRIGSRPCKLDLLDVALGLSLRVPHLPWSPGAGMVRTELAKEGLSVAKRMDPVCFERAVGPDVFILYWSLLRGLQGAYVPTAVSRFFEDGTSITRAERGAGRLRTCYDGAVRALLSPDPEMLCLFQALVRMRNTLSGGATTASSLEARSLPKPGTVWRALRRLGRWSGRKGAAAWSR